MRIAILGNVSISLTGGGGVRLRQVCRALAPFGEVTYVCNEAGPPTSPPPPGVTVLPLARTGASPLGRLPYRVEWWLRTWLGRESNVWQKQRLVDFGPYFDGPGRDHPPDLIHVTNVSIAATLPARLADVPLVIEHYDMLSRREEVYREVGETTAQQCRKVLADEGRQVHRARLNVVVSDDEGDWFRRHYPSAPLVVAPNGVDTEHYAPERAATIPGRLLFLGTLAYEPNLRGLNYFVEQVWPQVRAAAPDATLDVLGPGGDLFRQAPRGSWPPGVELLGVVDDVRPYYNRSAAVIVPILDGGGSRIKVAEGCAMACPMVATTFGAGGYGLETERHLLLADQAESFAAATVRLLTEPDQAAAMAARAREHVVAHYDWRRTLLPMVELYRDLAG